jgi:hypothetical protein
MNDLLIDKTTNTVTYGNKRYRIFKTTKNER